MSRRSHFFRAISPLLASAPAWLAVAAAPACDRAGRTAAKALDSGAPAAPGDSAAVRCTRDSSVPATFDVPEASGAAQVELRRGVRELFVVSDSGHKGAALLFDMATGATRATTLALDATAGDDVEGVAWLADAAGPHLFALTSSGAVRRFSPDGAGGLKRDRDAYRLGAPPITCDSLASFNCGRNYEGLCLRPPSAPRARCAGYAASKEEGRLYCLVFEGDRLVADPIKPPLTLAVPTHALSDCAFGADGGPAQSTLVVTTNVHGGSTSYVVDEASGALAAIDAPGTANNEAIAIDDRGALYVVMDTSSAPSPVVRYACNGW